MTHRQCEESELWAQSMRAGSNPLMGGMSILSHRPCTPHPRFALAAYMRTSWLRASPGGQLVRS